MSNHNWGIETDATDYFGARQKEVAMEQRRPVIRTASDLVGPGIAATAVRVSDYNDTLATFNGFFSSPGPNDPDGDPVALNAPRNDEAFVGETVSDSALGGYQTLMGLTTGVKWTRTFKRNSLDAATIFSGVWQPDITGRPLLIANVFQTPLYSGQFTLVNLTQNARRGMISLSEDAFIAQAAGFYSVTGFVNLTGGSSTSRRLVQVEKLPLVEWGGTPMGTGEVVTREENASSTNPNLGYNVPSLSGDVYCEVNDCIRVVVYQNSGETTEASMGKITVKQV